MATTANNLKPRRLIFSKEEAITTSNPTSYSFTPSSYSTVSINIYKYYMMVTYLLTMIRRIFGRASLILLMNHSISPSIYRKLLNQNINREQGITY